MFRKLLLVISLFFPFSGFSADIFKADRLFTSGEYPQAKQEYLLAANIGNPHAYYQLAMMYSKGLGVTKDPLNALIYFSLASEYNFHNSKELVDKTLNATPEAERETLEQLLNNFKKTHGKNSINSEFFPIIEQTNLDKKITFEGLAEQENKWVGDQNEGNDLVNDYLESIQEDDDLSLIMSSPLKPVIILEHDVNADGSIRYYSEVQKIGAPLNLVKNFILFPSKKPEFNGQPIEFINRTYIGAAAYSKFTFLREDPKLYEKILRLNQKLSQGTSIQDQYKYAMLLLNFPWLSQEDGEVDKRLLDLANKGHSLAMYEYGIKLYLEQKNIPQAIYWISQAGKYGLVRAEYRLGKLLQTSPWVVHDDKKALFWYELAMEKNHAPSTLRAIEIKLTSQDKSLHDLDKAISYLESIKDSESNNPEYYYLLALSHKDRKNRDFTQVVENLEIAIRKGSIANWDVSGWQDLLSRLTTGTVYIND